MLRCCAKEYQIILKKYHVTVLWKRVPSIILKRAPCHGAVERRVSLRSRRRHVSADTLHLPASHIIPTTFIATLITIFIIVVSFDAITIAMFLNPLLTQYVGRPKANGAVNFVGENQKNLKGSFHGTCLCVSPELGHHFRLKEHLSFQTDLGRMCTWDKWQKAA